MSKFKFFEFCYNSKICFTTVTSVKTVKTVTTVAQVGRQVGTFQVGIQLPSDTLKVTFSQSLTIDRATTRLLELIKAAKNNYKGVYRKATTVQGILTSPVGQPN